MANEAPATGTIAPAPTAAPTIKDLSNMADVLKYGFEFEEAIALSPERKPAAIESIGKPKNPNSATDWLVYACRLANADKIEQAADACDKFTSLLRANSFEDSLANESSIENRVIIYRDAQRFDDALKIVNLKLESLKDEADEDEDLTRAKMYEHRCLIHFLKGDSDRAMRDIDDAISAMTEFQRSEPFVRTDFLPSLYIGRSMLHERLGNSVEAAADRERATAVSRKVIADLTTEINATPTKDEIFRRPLSALYAARASAHESLGDKDAAAEDYARAKAAAIAEDEQE